MTALIDILVEDSRGAPLLVVECKNQPADASAEAQLGKYVSMVAGTAPFALLVDPSEIRVYRTDPNGGLTRVVTLPSDKTLRAYEPRFGQIRLFEQYMIDIVSAWLRDLIDHWRHPHPPGESELRQVGLLPLLANAQTRSEVRVGASALP